MPLRYDEIQEVENIARSIAKQEIQRAARRDNLIDLVPEAATDEPVKGPISPTGAGEGIPSDGGFLAKTGSKKNRR